MLQNNWKPYYLYGDDELCVIKVAQKGMEYFVDLTWGDDDLKNLPYQSVDGRSFIVPKEAVQMLRNKGLEINEVCSVVSAANLPEDERRKQRKKYGM